MSTTTTKPVPIIINKPCSNVAASGSPNELKPPSPSTLAAYSPSFSYIMSHPRTTIQRFLFGMHQKTKRTLAEEVESGDETSVGSWIQDGCNPNEVDSYGYTPLINAAANGRINALVELLKNSADVNMTGPFGYTALHASAQNGHREIVSLLLATNRCDINVQNEDGDTPMHLALAANRIEIVFLLLRHGSNVEIKGFGNKNCVQFAQDLGLKDIAERLENGIGNSPVKKNMIDDHKIKSDDHKEE